MSKRFLWRHLITLWLKPNRLHTCEITNNRVTNQTWTPQSTSGYLTPVSFISKGELFSPPVWFQHVVVFHVSACFDSEELTSGCCCVSGCSISAVFSDMHYATPCAWVSFCSRVLCVLPLSPFFPPFISYLVASTVWSCSVLLLSLTQSPLSFTGLQPFHVRTVVITSHAWECECKCWKAEGLGVLWCYWRRTFQRQSLSVLIINRLKTNTEHVKI